jgi:hypothetical protein
VGPACGNGTEPGPGCHEADEDRCCAAWRLHAADVRGALDAGDRRRAAGPEGGRRPVSRVWRNLSCPQGHRLVADLAGDTRQRGRRSWQPPGSRAP